MTLGIISLTQTDIHCLVLKQRTGNNFRPSEVLHICIYIYGSVFRVAGPWMVQVPPDKPPDWPFTRYLQHFRAPTPVYHIITTYHRPICTIYIYCTLYTVFTFQCIDMHTLYIPYTQYIYIYIYKLHTLHTVYTICIHYIIYTIHARHIVYTVRIYSIQIHTVYRLCTIGTLHIIFAVFTVFILYSCCIYYTSYTFNSYTYYIYLKTYCIYNIYTLYIL